MMLAALWGGSAMDHAGLGLIHALSGPLTSHLHLHHGLANALILPHALCFNLPAIAPERQQVLKEITGLPLDAEANALVKKMTNFVANLGLPTRLRQMDLNLENVDWETIAEETTRMVLIRNNPRPALVDDCRAVINAMLSY